MDAYDMHFFEETRPARLIAVGNRIDLHTATSEESFSLELERIVGLALDHLARDRPNLVVLGEVLGLPLALTGKRGYLPRRMHTSSVAMSMLALAYAPRIFHYRRIFPSISLVRALLLSLSNRMYRSFTTTLSQLAARHNIYLSASTIAPRMRLSTTMADAARVDRQGSKFYLPDGPEVYNTGFLWGPGGNLIGTADKVFLTENEKSILDLTPGDLECVQAFETEMGRVGMAISLDAFTPEYLAKLDSQGARIVIQNDANDAPWVSACKTCQWQPQEWLNSVLGSVQDEYPNLYYNVCSMQVGNFYDVPFDGQSTITMKSDHEPDPQCNFVGNEGFVHTLTGKPMKGEILAMSPWVIEDPIYAKPGMPVEERRALLEQVGKQLLPGGARANQYRESVIWADVEVPVA